MKHIWSTEWSKFEALIEALNGRFTVWGNTDIWLNILRVLTQFWRASQQYLGTPHIQVNYKRFDYIIAYYPMPRWPVPKFQKSKKNKTSTQNLPLNTPRPYRPTPLPPPPHSKTSPRSPAPPPQTQTSRTAPSPSHPQSNSHTPSPARSHPSTP